jgi:hypothetical protein
VVISIVVVVVVVLVGVLLVVIAVILSLSFPVAPTSEHRTSVKRFVSLVS